MAAITELERRSRDFLKEKKERSELEERINAMQSQMLGNGVGGFGVGGGDGKFGNKRVDQTAFDAKLKKEQNRIRDEYEGKIRELEADRVDAQEGRAQVGRYKAVLLKQRDIMIALTARLNERDETIIRMQEELKAYDAEYRRVEDSLDAKTAELIALRRAAMRHNAESPSRNDELVAALGGWAGGGSGAAGAAGAAGNTNGEERDTTFSFTPRRIGASEVFHDNDGSGDTPGHRDSARTGERDGNDSSDYNDLRNELTQKNLELDTLRAEIAVAAAQSRASKEVHKNENAHSSPDRVENVELQYQQFRKEMALRLEEKNGTVHQLEDENARLKGLVESAESSVGIQSNGAGFMESAVEKTALREKVTAFARERSALRTILENKIQALVVGVGRSVDSLGDDLDTKAPRLRREVRALERLVAATVQAMKH